MEGLASEPGFEQKLQPGSLYFPLGKLHGNDMPALQAGVAIIIFNNLPSASRTPRNLDHEGNPQTLQRSCNCDKGYGSYLVGNHAA